MPIQSLSSEKLRHIADHTTFDFETTADLEAVPHIIGQPRGTRSIGFGINIKSKGYNIYALGEVGTGRATAIQHYLHELTRDEPTPKDWIYVHNFSMPHRPRAIELAAGEARPFQLRIRKLIQELRQGLPQAFATDAYLESINQVQETFSAQQNELMTAVQQSALEAGFGLVKTASGFAIVPVMNGKQLTQQEVQQLSAEHRQQLEKEAQVVSSRLDEVLYQIHELEVAARQKMKEIDRAVAETAVQHHFADLLATCSAENEMCLYLEEMRQDVINQIQDFTSPVDDEDTIDLRRYEVNLLVDNSETKGAPVIREMNPTYNSLLGRLEYEMNQGFLSTHFTYIKCGSLHQANGGYLILSASDLLKNTGAWYGLKRALKEGKIHMQPLARMNQSEVLAKSLDPEPIDLDVKVVLLGSLDLYYALLEQDEDFQTLFKVRADFDSTMPRNAESEKEYACFVAMRCKEEGLHHFDRTAVSKVIEQGSRLADHQNKLSTRFGEMADLVRESSYWADINDRSIVTADDVQQALDERTYRTNRAEELTFEFFVDGTIFIATEGEVIGQVNGLSVLDMGDYSFGQPGRITARSFMGDDGITHIERETEMSGPIHEKGVLTLNGYLGGTYAQHQPLSVNISLTFEQNYSGVDGDSASSTELYAIISSLSRLPIKQGIAVTGSVNQRGEIQPIGGVNQKIEGFFRLCKARGLTGDQGVLIPATNMVNLMLHEDVVTAVSEGKFHIYPIKHLDEGIEILMGKVAGERHKDGTYPEGTAHDIVQTRLLEFAEELNSFGDDEEEADS